jgi:hypothetical protein
LQTREQDLREASNDVVFRPTLVGSSVTRGELKQKIDAGHLS